MSGAKETPRQKMIGMMYLVYTALLAMNVSKDILNAFDIVNSGVQETNISIARKIDMQYATFEQQYTLDKQKVGPYWTDAKQLQAKTDTLINYIEAIKWELVKTVEKPESFEEAVEIGLVKADTIQPNGRRKVFEINTSIIGSRDNFNDPTAFMIGGEIEAREGEAYKLSKKIRAYREYVIDLIGKDNDGVLPSEKWNGNKAAVLDSIGQKHGIALITNEKDYTEGSKGGDKIDWERYNFYHTVLIADVTLLNKLISEIQTAELNALTILYQNVHGQDFTFEHIGAKVIADNSYIVQGQEYKADALVTAWKDSKTKAWVLMGKDSDAEHIMERGQVFESDEIGTIKLRFPGNTVGEHEYHGIIEMRNPATNEMEKYPFNGKYTVAPPSVTISPTKMNVVYDGIMNPIKVSAPGFADNKVRVSASGASLTARGNGEYDLNVTDNAKEVIVTASAEDNGKSVNLGSFKLRVKPLPKPIVRIDNVKDGKVSKQGLEYAGKIVADMGQDFDFEGVHYDVTGFTMKFKTKAGSNKEISSNDARFTKEMLDVFKGAARGDMFIFTGIKVMGNDKKVKIMDSSIAVEIE